MRWQQRYLFIFLLIDSLPVSLYYFLDWQWVSIPWQPVSLIGIAVAFYTGFKNNSSYERLWEARKIWGGIVNVSRAFTVMARDFVNNDEAKERETDTELGLIRQTLVYRHIAWLYAMTIELRKSKAWEHDGPQDELFRSTLGLKFHADQFQQLSAYLDPVEFDYLMQKGNKSSHLLSLQSKHLIKLRQAGIVEHFRHLEMQQLITECFTLQGKSERIKNFPFPRQYATATYYFILLFILLLPFGMLNVFEGIENPLWIWLSIPFSIVGTWVFWIMERIGDYSENPFEGLYNDVPITSMARSIEIDIREMLEETDLPDPVGPIGDMQIMV